MKKLSALFVACALLLGLCACGTSNAGDDVENTSSGMDVPSGGSVVVGSESNGTYVSEINYTDDGRTIVRVAITADITNQGVWLASDGSGRKQVMYNVYETLAAKDSVTGELNGVLAKSWEATDEYTYEIELWDNIYDTAGNHITAEDVIWSFQTAEETKLRILKYIDTITATDEFHITMTLNSTDVDAFDCIMYQIFVVSQKAYEESGDQMQSKAIGTGPYVITDWQTGSKITLEKNENYWQSEDNFVNYQWQNVDVIEYVVITEETQRVIALETGTADIIPGIDYASVKDFLEGGSKSEGYGYISYAQNDLSVYFNCSDNSPCSDINLRKAICCAIDKQGLLTGVADGYGVVSQGAPTTYAGYLDSWADVDWYDYNIDKCKEYLDQSNYKGETLTLVLNPGSTGYSDAALMIQNYLGEVGINCKILELTSAALSEVINSSDGWDIRLYTLNTADSQVKTIVQNWSYANYSDGLLPIKILDSTLDEKLQALGNRLTSNDETLDEFFQYVCIDQCYALSLIGVYEFTVYRDWVFTCTVNENFWSMPGSYVYAWNE